MQAIIKEREKIYDSNSSIIGVGLTLVCTHNDRTVETYYDFTPGQVSSVIADNSGTDQVLIDIGIAQCQSVMSLITAQDSGETIEVNKDRIDISSFM